MRLSESHYSPECLFRNLRTVLKRSERRCEAGYTKRRTTVRPFRQHTRQNGAPKVRDARYGRNGEKNPDGMRAIWRNAHALGSCSPLRETTV